MADFYQITQASPEAGWDFINDDSYPNLFAAKLALIEHLLDSDNQPHRVGITETLSNPVTPLEGNEFSPSELINLSAYSVINKLLDETSDTSRGGGNYLAIGINTPDEPDPESIITDFFIAERFRTEAEARVWAASIQADEQTPTEQSTSPTSIVMVSNGSESADRPTYDPITVYHNGIEQLHADMKSFGKILEATLIAIGALIGATGPLGAMAGAISMGIGITLAKIKTSNTEFGQGPPTPGKHKRSTTDYTSPQQTPNQDLGTYIGKSMS